jgi:peptidoglycan/xylan/chitin deacetylase (PgdA/CDA1 family)
MSLLHNAQFSHWARGHLLCRVDDVPDRFALTFDDGPGARATPAILDVLEHHRARATFFTLAGNMERLPAIARQVAAAGHELAAHGDTHWPLPLLPPPLLRREIERSVATIVAITGCPPAHYRPPFGFMTPGQARFVRSLGCEPVLGDVYPEDPHRPGVDRIVARVLPRLCGGSILILHDGSPFGEADRTQTVAALGIILGCAAQSGLRAVTIANLLGEPANAASSAGAGAITVGTTGESQLSSREHHPKRLAH